MGRRKKTHNSLAYALVPRFMYVALSRGLIDPTAFTVWATIRLYVRDEERGEFSPAPIDLTNREIAEAAGLTRRGVINIIKRLETGGFLCRLAADELVQRGLSGNRWLLLQKPATLNDHSVNGDTVNGDSVNGDSVNLEEDITLNTREVIKPKQDPAKKDDFALVASSELEGGVGGTNNPEQPFSERRNSEQRYREITRILQQCRVFRSSAFDIAEQMLSEDPTRDAQWAEDAFYRVFNEEHVNGVSTEQAIRRTVARLKNGDWGNLDDVAAEARRRKQVARQQYYGDLAERFNRQPEQVETQPESVSAAQRLWDEVLGEVELQMTRATFDTWLRDTQCQGITDNTLVIQAKNEYAIEWLESKLYPIIQRALHTTLEAWPDTNPDVNLELDESDNIAVTFTVKETANQK